MGQSYCNAKMHCCLKLDDKLQCIFVSSIYFYMLLIRFFLMYAMLLVILSNGDPGVLSCSTKKYCIPAVLACAKMFLKLIVPLPTSVKSCAAVLSISFTCHSGKRPGC